ncbi:anti-phage ZorAB system protein ZorA, partial [Pseudomonas aeruginosa]|uniref:anti-phage ZorAB system protein ZorA n=3 Tax=Pseudomonas aeruginosa TaxID=287 RepID=UPI0021566C5D
EGVGATAAALVDLSTVAGNKISNPPWVKFQSAGWVNFPSAPTLVGNFMDGMTSVGREQGLQMQQAAADVNAAVSGMSERLNQLFSSLNEQQGRQMEVAQQQSAAFETQLQRISGSAEERQAQMEQRFAELMSGLTNQLQTQLGTAQQRDEERQVLFERLLGQASSSQTAMLEQFSSSTREQMQAMAEAGNERHSNLEKVFSRLMMNLNTQLDSQMGAAEQREQARQQRFQEQLDQVSTHQQELLSGLASAVQATQQQSRLMADQHQQLLGQLKQVSDATAQSSKHMDSSANQLGLLSANLRQAADSLGQRLEAVSHSIERAGQQNAELATQLQSQAATLAQLQATLLEGAQRFEQAAGEARNGFGEMKSAQQEFLSSVRHEFTALGEKLREQVEAVEKQAEEWLRSYAGEVRVQTDERMNQWNEVSLKYADQMHRVVQNMSSILDELEAR